jgi:ribosomal protein S19
MFDDIQFRLPITYCEELHTLPTNVVDDLELSSVIHSKIFQTENHFGTHVSKEWSKHITSNVNFLQDTQSVINNMKKFNAFPKLDTNRVIEIWQDTKCNSNFLEKYNYMDWEKLVHFNESPLFLQIMSSINILSPVISLVIPLIILILPFFILQMKGIRLMFNEYLRVLKDLAVNHFFKGQLNTNEMGVDKILYIILYFGLYVMQLYQNISTCNKFYNNIQAVNKNLIDFKTYLGTTINKMKLFIDLNNYNSYKNFNESIKTHLINIELFYQKLNNVTPFKINMNKVNDFGYMLSCYYELKNNQIYDESLKFFIGFEGYINNLSCIDNFIFDKKMTNATFDTNCEESFTAKEQIYPPHCGFATSVTSDFVLDKQCVISYPIVVTNDINLKKNIIITGPNASGKTTYIKSTAINIILSQQFGCGFYKKCTLNPFTHIHSYLNIPDTSERDSLFQAESRRCKNILDTIDNGSSNSRHFCIFDELYTGTNTESSSKASYSLLVYLCNRKNVNFILTTHDTNVCKKINKLKCKSDNKSIIKNLKMDVIETPNKLEYTYKVKNGISYINGAIHVLKEMNYPAEIIDTFITYDKL